MKSSIAVNPIHAVSVINGCWCATRIAVSAVCGMTVSRWIPTDQVRRLFVLALSCLWWTFWKQSNHRT